ncbi:MAG TPA: OsmC family protein [Candidatus Methylomirabilis sp.]|nr:OsmC family protein [Candidatus Methylomirabilis sp.]
MYGTLRGALAGRKIAFDRDSYKATVEGRITGVGKTIRIESIRVHYEVTVPAEAREATERALALHPLGCPAHQSVKGAIAVSWTATLRAGEEVLQLSGE